MKTLACVCVCIWVSPRKFSKNDKTIQICFGLFINNHNIITKDDSKLLNIPLNSIFTLYYYTTYSPPPPPPRAGNLLLYYIRPSN